MSFKIRPHVVEAFSLSLSSGPLQAAEASINSVRFAIEDELPEGDARAAILQCLQDCWLLCALIFSAGQTHGNTNSPLSKSAELAADINQQNALELLSTLRIKIVAALGEGKGTDIADRLISTGQIIDTLYAAGKIDGSQVALGKQHPMRRGDKTC